MKTIISPAALKALKALPRKEAEALSAKIERFAADPFAYHGKWATKLVGSEAYRIRQGDYRTLCVIDRKADAVVIEAIGGRKEIYR